MANEWIREFCVRQPLMNPQGSASPEPVRRDYDLVSEKTGAKVAEPSRSGGYCQACFKEFRSDFRSLDANGNCRIHGGQLGQSLGVTKTQTKVGLGLLGAVALLFLSGGGEGEK